jgi:hypothetical protein
LNVTAAESILAKVPMPTHLDSAAIRSSVAAEVRRRSIFSATATREKYLLRLRDTLARVAQGEWNDARAREVLQRELDVLGYDAEAGGFPGDLGLVQPAERGSLRDLASRARLDLQLETNTRMARSAAQAKAGSSPYALREYPAWSLERIYGRRVPRDWAFRWEAAGQAVGWKGAARSAPSLTGEPRMIALKDSPIWQAIGDGAGGFDDTLGNAFPPFAFGSGMGWREVPKAEAAKLGLGPAGEPDTDMTPGQNEIADALGDLGPDFTANLLKELSA